MWTQVDLTLCFHDEIDLFNPGQHVIVINSLFVNGLTWAGKQTRIESQAGYV